MSTDSDPIANSLEVPNFDISRRPGGFAAILNQKETFIPADISTLEGRRAFTKTIIELYPDFAHRQCGYALWRWIRELAAGQPCAGRNVDQIRAVIHAIARSLKDQPDPKTEENPPEEPRTLSKRSSWAMAHALEAADA